MSGQFGSDRRPNLRVVRPTPTVDRDTLRQELVACIAAEPNGLAPSRLMGALADRLGVAVDDIDDGDVDVALGLLVVSGQIDEAAGLLVAIGAARRQVG